MALTPQFWDRYFRVYDTLNNSPVYRELIDVLLGALDPQPGEHVLDAGVGTGNIAIEIKKRGSSVLGLDFSTEALRIYREKDPSAHVALVDLSEPLPFEDNEFDKIISNNTLYNIPRPLRLGAMRELQRVLRPGGTIVVSNVHRRYKPIRIYGRSIALAFRNLPLYEAVHLLIGSFFSTMQIFYYNRLIQQELKSKSDNLFEMDEQRGLLEEAGFRDISPTKLVFGDQGIMNSARK